MEALLIVSAFSGVLIFYLGYFVGRKSVLPAEADPALPFAIPEIIKRKAYTTGKRKPVAHDDAKAWEKEREMR